MPSIFKKVKLLTGENVGSGPVNLPEEEVHSSGFWIAIGPQVETRFAKNELSQAMFGAANALVHVAPLHLMCDARDIYVAAHRRNPITKRPTIFIYERLPEAVGLVEKLFQQHQLLLATAAELIQTCICQAGCPSCVGPEEQVGSKGKRLALDLLNTLSER
jgi:DEAD/DEAH box helicase domain-containing protein